jgi:hypothetical protein
LLFHSRSGLMLGKLRLRWTGPYSIMNKERGTYQLGTLSGKVLSKWANGFRLKPYYEKLPPNLFRPTVQARQRRTSPPQTRNRAVVTLRQEADEVVQGWRIVGIVDTMEDPPAYVDSDGLTQCWREGGRATEFRKET